MTSIGFGPGNLPDFSQIQMGDLTKETQFIKQEIAAVGAELAFAEMDDPDIAEWLKAMKDQHESLKNKLQQPEKTKQPEKTAADMKGGEGAKEEEFAAKYPFLKEITISPIARQLEAGEAKSPQDVLNLLNKNYPGKSYQVDQALDYLKATVKDGEALKHIEDAQKELRKNPVTRREIIYRNAVYESARTAGTEGLSEGEKALVQDPLGMVDMCGRFLNGEVNTFTVARTFLRKDMDLQSINVFIRFMFSNMTPDLKNPSLNEVDYKPLLLQMTQEIKTQQAVLQSLRAEYKHAKRIMGDLVEAELIQPPPAKS